LSNLSAHRPADYRLESFLPKNLGWEETALFSSATQVRQYGDTDWTDVPKIDYSSGGFTQLSIPEPAEVVEEGDEGGEFVLDDLDALRQMGQRKSDKPGDDKSKQSAQNRNARALTLELVKTTYKVQDLSKSERLAREKLTNPQAHSNADQPFIPTYGESRRALLKKLGFSDDYELSLSGVGKNKVKAKEKPDERVANNGDTERETSETNAAPSDFESLTQEQDAFEDIEAKNKTDIEGDQEEDAKDLLDANLDDRTEDFDSKQSIDEEETDEPEEELDISASEAKLAREKAYEEGYQKAMLEAKEKAAVQESFQAEIALKEEQKSAEAQAAKDKEAQLQREKERKEYETEIENLKDKIKSFDESLLGELEKKKEQLDKEMKPKVKVLTDLCNQLKELTDDSQSFFEPLKRLSVHIAEQLVLGELSTSPKVIERLVQRCIDELDMRDTPVVKVELNPLDKALLESVAGTNLDHLKVSVGQSMQVGSVRVSVNDTQIEDLIQNRLESIATRLLGQPQEWKDHSSLMNKIIDQSYFDASKVSDKSAPMDELESANSDALARETVESLLDVQDVLNNDAYAVPEADEASVIDETAFKDAHLSDALTSEDTPEYVTHESLDDSIQGSSQSLEGIDQGLKIDAEPGADAEAKAQAEGSELQEDKDA